MSRDLLFVVLVIILALGLGAYFLVGRVEEPGPGSTTGQDVDSVPEEPLPDNGETAGERPPPVPAPQPPPGESGETESDEPPKPDEAPGKPDLTQKVSVDFEDTTIEEFITWMVDNTGVRFETAGDLLDRRISLKGDGLSVKSVIELVTLTMGLSWELTPEGTVRISAD